jgi:hypothetical protein
MAVSLILSASLLLLNHRRRSAWQQTDCNVFQIKTEGGTWSGVVRHCAAPAHGSDRLLFGWLRLLPRAMPRARNELLFIAQGGPGGSSIKSLRSSPVSPQLRPAKTVTLCLGPAGHVLFRPALLVPRYPKPREASDRHENSETEKDELQRDGYRACGERLCEVGDLSAFNIAETLTMWMLSVRLSATADRVLRRSYGTELDNT